MNDWWRGAVIYQIYPRSFQDSNADGIGDLPGILRRIPYVAQLGVDAIWISPFYRSPMIDFGYDIEDYREVDPIFGTLKDFDLLLAAAHRHGLKVIIDMVLSHTSIRHRWFQESRRTRGNPKDDWYVWADPRPDGTAPNNWLSMFGGPAWTWEPRREQYYLHNFLPEQPDLNLHNHEVQEALITECRFWLERGVDGFRLDACNFLMHDPLLRANPPRPPEAPPTDGVKPNNPYNRQLHIYDKTQPEALDFLRYLRNVTQEYGDIVLIAEIAADDSLKVMQEYAGLGGPLHTAYSFALLGETLDTQLLPETFFPFHDSRRHGWPSWAFSNHDVSRVATRWGGRDAPDAYCKLLIAMLTCLRGTIFLYQGEELGLPETDVPYEQIKDPYGLNFFPDFPGRDGCRTPMPWDDNDRHAGFSTVDGWLPVPNEHLRRSVGAQEATADSVLSFTRNFLRWRKGQAPLILGGIDFLTTERNLVAFTRTLGEERLLAAFNLDGIPRSLPLPGPVREEMLNHGLPQGDVADGQIQLPPFGAFFVLLK
ncbi:alpha-glucosidase [Oceanibaculum sp.]|uniref:alpha-glucosidase n=1 Tax=Oceanibaculum sp. TaxID=1903597 RepID=UPI002582AD52|nr:alpha-glucosidase [Oceanibaculum sp.]MCH2394304.1 alpha-glucosidase family protein [Oceanibaculum sp.]